MKLTKGNQAEYIRHRSCERKKGFTIEEANRIGAKFNQYKYKCISCGKFHLTKMRQKVKG